MKNIIFFTTLILIFNACADSVSTDSSKKKPEKILLDKAFTSMFENIEVVKMHFFSTMNSDMKDYPYVGKKIDPTHFESLDEGLLENSEQGIFATYRVQNDYYVLRVPNRDFSNKLVLCGVDKKKGKLKELEVLASAGCRTDRCHQRDAWLDDLDLDKELELIIRSRDENNEGKVVGSLFRVMTADGRGGFEIGKDDLANATSYVLKEGILPLR